MTQEVLDFEGVLAKLLELNGEHVDFSLRAADRPSRLVILTEGVLEGAPVQESPLLGAIGYDRDSMQVFVGEMAVNLHPDGFVEGLLTDETPGTGAPMRHLTSVMEGVEMTFRTSSAS